MRLGVTAAFALAGALLRAIVFAQAASPAPETRLQQEMRHRRVIVRPATPLGEVQRDVDTATAEVERGRREDGVVRDLTRPAPRQPQMDQDLRGGIQTRALNDARRR
jgi:hypothetical protein